MKICLSHQGYPENRGWGGGWGGGLTTLAPGRGMTQLSDFDSATLFSARCAFREMKFRNERLIQCSATNVTAAGICFQRLRVGRFYLRRERITDKVTHCSRNCSFYSLWVLNDLTDEKNLPRHKVFSENFSKTTFIVVTSTCFNALNIGRERGVRN